jgi:hypothetical protein
MEEASANSWIRFDCEPKRNRQVQKYRRLNHWPASLFTVSLTSLTHTPYHLTLPPHRDDHGKGGNGMPRTTGLYEATPRRNIHRKHDLDPNQKAKPQHGSSGGKGKWKDIDDGSMMADGEFPEVE